MTGPTHVVIGFAASVALARANNLTISAIDALLIVLGSLLPDIDTEESSIARPSRIFRLMIPRGLGEIIDGLVQVFCKILRIVLGHRGATHWPIIPVSFYVFAIITHKTWLVWLSWSYLWHILADFCTKAGVPLFGPFSNKNIKWSPIATGSILEFFIASIVSVYVCFAGFSLLPLETREVMTQYVKTLGKIW